MSRTIRQRRQFSIERLEERVVPGCLLWNGGFLDEDINAVAVSFSADAAPRAVPRIAARVVPAMAGPILERPEPDRAPISPQAHELLHEIDRELSEAERQIAAPVEILLESIEQRLNIRPVATSNQPLSENDKLLLEIERERNEQVARSARSLQGQ